MKSNIVQVSASFKEKKATVPNEKVLLLFSETFELSQFLYKNVTDCHKTAIIQVDGYMIL